MRKLVALFVLVLMASCSASTSSNDDFSANDIMFAQMMIPHHQQAVDLGAIALDGEASPEVLALAKQIADHQTHEIEHMQAWLDAAGASEHMDHDMAMDGMLTEAQLDALKAAMSEAGVKRFGSGWSWLISAADGTLSVASTANQDSPVMGAAVAGCDQSLASYRSLKWLPLAAGQVHRRAVPGSVCRLCPAEHARYCAKIYRPATDH